MVAPAPHRHIKLISLLPKCERRFEKTLMIFCLNTSSVSNLLHFYFDIRTMEVGLSSPHWEHHGAGLACKRPRDAKRGKAKEKKGVAKRDFNKDSGWVKEKLLNGTLH